MLIGKALLHCADDGINADDWAVGSYSALYTVYSASTALHMLEKPISGFI